MSFLSIFTPAGREKAQSKVLENLHDATERQIAEAKAAVAEVGLLKEALVERANGAVYKLKKRGGGYEGESES